MIQKFLIKKDQPHLILFFAGWGMDETPFQQIHSNGCDWMICYDYRSLDFDDTLIQKYSHITLVAWSMGVWVASQMMQRLPHLPIVHSVAINGTLYPIDDTRGIAHSIFEGTLQGLNEQTLLKFQKRMCGSVIEYKEFLMVAPKRTVEELKEELAAIQHSYLTLPPSSFTWQKAIIGKNDRIFSTENQRQAWKDKVDLIEETDAAHYQKDFLF
ncbi:pimeloyl-ACP methyl esterase BioG family protein [Bacteroides sp.]|uniref:DUF452 family protein n=1 Tax=Bacteroides sp. TaxID=29523 RepID=UPI002633BF3E|nr:pimeloyl-ACP methyl esterase BioG family protein [Bacteroides sp.]MDD3037832.1 DUF452 family protein [Bacteroides sp.]